MSAHHTHTWCPRRLEGGIRYLGIVAIDGCELPCRLREGNPRPLENQQVPLTTELSLSRTPQVAFQIPWGGRDRSDLEGAREQGGNTHRHFSAQCRRCSRYWPLTFWTHHCVVNPCWKEVIQAFGVNEASIIVKEAPEYQKYKLEGNTKVLLLDLVFSGGF